MGEKRSELSSVYYFFPFTTTSELEGETLSFDERLIFTKSSGPFPTRNLMRSDVKTCIESIKHYRLDKDIHPTLKSYCFLRDENNRKTNKVVLANLSDILILHTISIYSFDKENQFLVLHCYFKDESSKDRSYQSFDMEKVIRAHGHFVNNVFKSKLISLKNADGVLVHDIEPELVVQDEPYNVLEGWETHDSFITLAIGDKEYTFSGGKDSLPEITGFKFEFKDYQVHYLSRLFLYEDNLENRYSYAERLSGGSMRTYMERPERNALDTKRYTAMFSYFGSSIISFKPDELDIEKDKEEIEYLNEANKRLFLHELFYDFLIAINYRIRIKRQILDIGKINYNDNSPQK